MTRFADEKLQAFYEEFIRHAQEENSYRVENDELLKKLLESNKETIDAIKALEAKSEGAIRLYEDMAAGGRILDLVGKVGASLIKVGLIVAGIFGLNHFFGKP